MLHNKLFNKKSERRKYLKQAESVTFNLFVPSFQRLAIIYENQDKYAEAIEICKLALNYGLHDNTKADFKGRIEKLAKKALKIKK